MEKADATIIATALPAIAADLGVDAFAVKLALTSYLIALAIFIPVSGWLADRHGARRVFCLAIGVFMAGSLGCAAAQSLGELVAARFVQGAGGAMMSPVGRIVLLRNVPRQQLVGALALLAAPALLGTVSGPLLGGVITTWLHWRWIFLINLPVGVIGIILARRFITEQGAPDQDARLDLAGAALAGGGLALTLFALSAIGAGMAPPATVAIAGASGLALLALYLRHAARAPAPVLYLALLGIPTYRAALCGGMLFRIVAGAVPSFLLPLMLQSGFGMSASEAGAVTFISGVGALFTKTLASRILGRFGFPLVLAINGALAAGFIGAYGFFTPATSMAFMLAAVFLGGCLRSLQFTALNALSYADVPARHIAAATSLYAVSQHVALALGVCIGALALQGAQALRGGETLLAADFPPAFVAVALASLASLTLLLRLPQDAGASLRRPASR